MNLSDLPIGTLAKITSTRKGLETYSFSGEIKFIKETATQGSFIWLTHNDKMGYVVLPEYDYLWKVEVLKKQKK